VKVMIMTCMLLSRPAQYQVNILKKLRSINIDYHQVGWYQSTYLSSHITKDFLESHVRYQQAIEESVVLIYGEDCPVSIVKELLRK